MTLKKKDINDVAALFKYKNSIKLVCANGYKICCYPILAGFIVDYKEQVFSIYIKANMQYSICHVSPKQKRIHNPIMGAMDQSVNMDSACTITQQLSYLAEQCCKWLVALTRVLCIGLQAYQYLCYSFV